MSPPADWRPNSTAIQGCKGSSIARLSCLSTYRIVPADITINYRLSVEIKLRESSINVMKASKSI